MKREFLTKELSLSKEMTDKIMAQYGESVNSLKTEQERLLKENEDLKAQVEAACGVEARVSQLETEKSALEKNVGELTEELKNSKVNYEVSSRLILSGAKNLKAVSALIDKSKITFEEDCVLGLAEQIDAIKEECGYLFYDDTQSSGMRHSSASNKTDGFTSYARAGAKLN